MFGDQIAQFSAVLAEKLSLESSVYVLSQSRAEINMEQTKGVKLRWAIWEPFGIRRDSQRQVHFVQIIKILERFLNADHDGLTATIFNPGRDLKMGVITAVLYLGTALLYLDIDALVL